MVILHLPRNDDENICFSAHKHPICSSFLVLHNPLPNHSQNGKKKGNMILDTKLCLLSESFPYSKWLGNYLASPHCHLEREELDKGHFLHLLGFQELCFLLYLIRSASCKAIHCSGEVHTVNYDSYNQFFTVFAAVMGFKYHNVCQKDKIMSLCFLLTDAFMTGFCS